MAKDDRIVKLYDLSQEDIVRLVFSLLTNQVKVKVILIKWAFKLTIYSRMRAGWMVGCGEDGGEDRCGTGVGQNR